MQYFFHPARPTGRTKLVYQCYVLYIHTYIHTYISLLAFDELPDRYICTHFHIGKLYYVHQNEYVYIHTHVHYTQHTWKAEGQVFYSNWLSVVLRRKEARS